MAVVVACQNDDLPKANFNLNTVTSLSGEVAHEKVDLTWQAPQSGTPQSYILKWSPDGETITIDPSTTSYGIDGLDNGTDYIFSIQVDYGDGGISGKKEVNLRPLDELNFNVLPGNQLAVAVWETPSRTDISGYTLSWSPNGQEVTIDSGKNVYQVTGLDNDVEYTFTFKANFSGGTSSNNLVITAAPGEIQAFLLSESIPVANSEVQFTFNSAFLPQSVATSWSWDFGDGGISTKENPIHKFETPGTYDVYLQITDDQGLIFSDSKTVQVWGEKWSYTIGKQIKPQIPAIADDGTIYIGSEDNENFHAINPDGSLKWTYTGIADNVYSSASIGKDGTIYVGSKDNRLHAINPDGTQKWTFPMGGDAIFASPAISTDGVIYIGSDSDSFFAVNPDGSQKWVFSTAGFNIRSSPAIGADGTVYMASDDDNLYALNPVDGSISWSFNVGGDVEGGVSIDGDGSILVSVDQGSSTGAVYAINSDGTQKWVKSTNGRILSSPTIAKGTVYVGTKDSDELVAIDSSNGSQIWSYTAGDIILSTPAIDVNGNIYFGSFDDNIHVLNPDGTLRFSVDTGANVWSSVAIGTDGTVYIGGYDGKLHAFEFFAEGLASDAWPMFGKNLKHTSR